MNTVSNIKKPSIAVLIPCHNEAANIRKVIQDFRNSIPDSLIFVYDNNSTDRTKEIAAESDVIVRTEPLQGKGNVVRRMFSDVEADVYVLVDGDDTYDAQSAPVLVRKLIDDHLDMVNGSRVTEIKAAYRPGHRFGNVILTNLVGVVFGNRFKDMLSGYRVFSRRFVKSFPALSTGFEIETELTVHALTLDMPVSEIETSYKERSEDSTSKLRTLRDGFIILKTIGVLVKEERPLQFFTVLSVLLFLISIGLAWPIVIEFMETGLVPRFPTAILTSGLMLIAFVSFGIGLILDSVTRGRREMKRLWYLSISSRWEL